MKIILNISIIILLIIINKIYKNKNFKIKKFIINKYNIKKGIYNTVLSNCISCHTINGGKPFTGGLSIKTPFGIINTPNITFEKKTGIGYMNLKEFIKSLKYGISKKNNFLYPIFPYINYFNIKKKDIKSIYSFLKTIPKENIINKKNYLKFPFKYRKLLIGWRLMFLKLNKINISKKKSSSINRGEYIIESLGHCNMCHTKTNILGGRFKKLNYLGNVIKPENWYAVPLINNKSIIKTYTLKELSNILKTGINKNNYIIGSMSEVINNSLQYISKIDIKAMASYIKTLFNKNIFFLKKKNIFKFKKNFSKLIFKEGKLIYKNNCLNCHGELGLGKSLNSPSLNKNIINKNFTNNIFNILKKPNKTITLKKFFINIMPNFNIFKNNLFIKIINYLYFLKYLKKN